MAAALTVTDELALHLRAVGDLAAAAGVSREEVVVITQCPRSVTTSFTPASATQPKAAAPAPLGYNVHLGPSPAPAPGSPSPMSPDDSPQYPAAKRRHTH
ncbi:hypothetical protein ZWY2020_002172 [Hordeum vulgare]|nr:hypothetical protein ZWY2020_002172 [Hordeum vulgare]